MQPIVREFFARLHNSHLKARGYRKQRNTFSRERAGFTERVQFQGSSWNSRGDESWLFHVNFGVQFHGLPPRSQDRDLPGTHCWARIESIIPGVPSQFHIVGDDRQLAGELASHLELASERVAKHVDLLRKRYEESGTPRLSLE
jgi:hypothetical protein